MDRDEAYVEQSASATSVKQGPSNSVKGPGKGSILHEIFRKDALAESHNALGAPIKPVGVATSALTAFFMVVLVSVILFLVTAKYARKETVSGQVTPIEGSFKIAAQIAGTADSVFVREGQSVKAGDILISVSADPILDGGTLIDSLKAIQASQRRAQEL